MAELRPEQAAPRDQVGRAVGIVGLLAIALIHFLDAFGKFDETPYIGALYIVLMVTTLVVSVVLLRTDSRMAWMLALAAAGLTLLGYILSRTTGLPNADEDIGNWTEPLGLASLWVEGLVVLLALYKAATTPRIRRRRGEPVTSIAGRAAA
jgi:hypothetical protein